MQAYLMKYMSYPFPYVLSFIVHVKQQNINDRERQLYGYKRVLTLFMRNGDAICWYVVYQYVRFFMLGGGKMIYMRKAKRPDVMYR
jgi:hypothetical protein